MKKYIITLVLTSTFVGCSNLDKTNVKNMRNGVLLNTDTLLYIEDNYTWNVDNGIDGGSWDDHSSVKLIQVTLSDSVRTIRKILPGSGRVTTWGLEIKPPYIKYNYGFNVDQFVSYINIYDGTSVSRKLSYGSGVTSYGSLYYTNYNEVYSITTGIKQDSLSIPGHNKILFFDEASKIYLVYNNPNGIAYFDKESGAFALIKKVTSSPTVFYGDMGKVLIINEWRENIYSYLKISDILTKSEKLIQLNKVSPGYVVSDVILEDSSMIITKSTDFSESNSKISILKLDGTTKRIINDVQK